MVVWLLLLLCVCRCARFSLNQLDSRLRLNLRVDVGKSRARCYLT